MLRRALAPVAAALLAAAGVAVPTAPAQAAACSTASGVTVVVDFSGQGGGVEASCDPAGASKSAAALLDAAFGLTYAQRQPGFICRVRGVPAADPCVNTSPANAYWGLFASDGRSGTWTYSSSGAGGLRVPDGGYVALAWQDGGAQDHPGLAPTARGAVSTPSSKPIPSSKPTATQKPKATSEPKASSRPQPSSAGQQPSGTPRPAPTTTPTVAGSDEASTAPSTEASPAARRPARKPGRSAAADPSPDSDSTTAALPSVADPSPGSTTGAEPVGDEPGGRVPTWLSLLLLAALPLGAALAWWRRREAPAP